MRIQLKHVKRVRKRLADGAIRIYHYHQRTGKKIEGEPGTNEFLESYKIAAEARPSRALDTLGGLASAYQKSGDFVNGLKPRTQSDYRKQIAKIEQRFGAAPIGALEDRRIRRDFIKWRDVMAKSSLKQADYAITVLARLLGWAVDQYLIENNHAAKIKKLYKSARQNVIWTPAQVKSILQSGHAGMRDAVLLAYDTGQRQGDLLKLSWNAYDGEGLTIRQSKTGRVVYAPCTRLLKARLDHAPRKSTTILTNKSGKPWTSDGFRTMFDRAKKKAEIDGVTFHDLRGTFATRLAECGATDAEINSITGHSDGSQLQTTYLSRTKKLAWSAIRKLETETGTKLETGLETGPVDNIRNIR